MPPKPKVVKIETLNMVHRGIFPNCYRIHAGTKEKQLTFILDICVPVNEKISRYRIEDGEKFPVLLCGDGVTRLWI